MNERDMELLHQAISNLPSNDGLVAEFAKIVRADEREACSKMLENTDLAGLASDPKLQAWVANLLFAYAKAIRARGNT